MQFSKRLDRFGEEIFAALNNRRMELEQQGLIYPVKGKGSFVTDSSRIRQIGMEEALSELKEIAEKGKALGVGEEEMIGVIRSCYKEGNND